MVKQLLAVSVLLLVFQGGAYAVLKYAKSSTVRSLRGDLSEIPMQLETPGQRSWRGGELSPDDEIVRTTGARHAISRLYVDESGRGISVHIGDWDSLKTPTLPHPPWICYPANGAQIVGEQDCEIEADGSFIAKLLTIENRGIRSLVLYWYAWDDTVCTTRQDATLTRLGMIGSREWPPVIKVMLETSAGPSEEAARRSLLDFAKTIRNQTRAL